MFRNINANTIEPEKNKVKENMNKIFSNVFCKEYIVLYIISFMLS